MTMQSPFPHVHCPLPHVHCPLPHVHLLYTPQKVIAAYASGTRRSDDMDLVSTTTLAAATTAGGGRARLDRRDADVVSILNTNNLNNHDGIVEKDSVLVKPGDEFQIDAGEKLVVRELVLRRGGGKEGKENRPMLVLRQGGEIVLRQGEMMVLSNAKDEGVPTAPI